MRSEMSHITETLVDVHHNVEQVKAAMEVNMRRMDTFDADLKAHVSETLKAGIRDLQAHVSVVPDQSSGPVETAEEIEEQVQAAWDPAQGDWGAWSNQQEPQPQGGYRAWSNQPDAAAGAAAGAGAGAASERGNSSTRGRSSSPTAPHADFSTTD